MGQTTKTLSFGLVSAVIAIVLLSSVLVPIASDASVKAGPPVEVANTSSTTYLISEYEGDTTIEIYSNGSFIVFDINGVENVLAAVANTNVLISDAVYINPNSGGTLVTLTFADGTTKNVSGSNTAKLTFSEGMLTAEHNGTEVYSGTYSYLYSLNGEGTMRYRTLGSGGILTVNDLDQICFAGTTTVNGSTVYYSCANGVVTGTSGYTFTLETDIAPRDGTNLLYQITSIHVIINDGVSDHTVNVTRPTADRVVHGYESGSANETLIAIIPLLIAAGIVLGVIGTFITRRD